MNNRTVFGVAAAAALMVWGCKPAEVEFPPQDNTEEVEAFYKANPERFVFATLDDLPVDLKWENGMDLPDIGSPEAKKGGTQRQRFPDFPRTLRHVGPDSTHTIRNYVLDNVMMAYVYRHPNVDGWFPGVAKEWAVDPENATVYIRLDPEARWNDGKPVTTEDVLFSHYFLLSPHTQAPRGQWFVETKYKRLTVYDGLTFAITCGERRPDFYSDVFETRPVPRHFFLEHGEDFVQRYQWKFVPTTGAYVIKPEDIKKGKWIALVRDENWWAKDRKYWRNRFNPDRIELKVVRDYSKYVEAFKKGDFDILRLNLTEVWYEKVPNDDPLVQGGYIHKSVFYNDSPKATMGLWLNTSKPLLDNVHIRRGLHHASNWDLVVDKFFRNDWGRLRTTSDGYGEMSRTDIVPREFSIEKAEAEFATAGFSKRGPDGILVNDKGERLSFMLTSGYKTLEDAMTILKQEALRAGVELKLEVLESTAGWKKVQEKKHEIALTGTGSSPTEIYPRYWDFWHSDNAFEDGKLKPNTNNFTATAIPGLDELIDKYAGSEEHDEKKDLAHRIEDILYDHAAWVPGVDTKFYRVGSWRWVKWPEDFNVKRSGLEEDWWVHWIDEDARAETKEAMKAGKTFPPEIKVYDKYKPE